MNKKGLTLVEVSIVVVIMSILAMIALPSVQLSVKRGDEIELKRVLRKTREAIDKYWENQNKITPGGIDGLKYPKDLQTLLDNKILRNLPVDPMTGEGEWHFISSTDDKDSKETNGDNIWNLRSISEDLAIDGTEYSTW